MSWRGQCAGSAAGSWALINQSGSHGDSHKDSHLLKKFSSWIIRFIPPYYLISVIHHVALYTNIGEAFLISHQLLIWLKLLSFVVIYYSYSRPESLRLYAIFGSNNIQFSIDFSNFTKATRSETKSFPLAIYIHLKKKKMEIRKVN